MANLNGVTFCILSWLLVSLEAKSCATLVIESVPEIFWCRFVFWCSEEDYEAGAHRYAFCKTYSMCVFMHKHVYVCICAIYVCTWECLYVCMYVMYVCMHVCGYVRMHACMWVCIYVYV
jgi:hypothetical protein